MKKTTAVLSVFAALLFMGAKGCSNCEKATAAAVAVCQATGEESDACKTAKAEAAKECKPDPEPTPTPTPTPTPPPASCATTTCPPEKPLCAETPEGPTCYKPTPNVCPPCAEGYECLDPLVGCQPKPPAPPAGCVIPDADDPAWGTPIPVGQRPTLMYQAYKRAIEKVGNRCGYASADESKQMQTLKDIAAALVADGVCAAQSADSVSIKAPDNLFEEWHAVYFGNGCIIDGPNAYKGAWPYGGPTTPPTPPPSSYACPAPVPPRLWTAETLPAGWGEDMIGKPRFEVKAKPHGAVVDSTPVVGPRACDYCLSIGMGELDPGVPRCSCPVRPDGHPDRVACEDVLLVPSASVHGPKWVKDGSTLALVSCDLAPDSEPCVTENTFQAKSKGVAIRACSWDMAACSPAITN
jgi:hypothetical protein